MVETVDTEWSQLAIDDGTVSLEYEEYDVVIGGDDVEKIAATPTKVRYSPSVNKAKNLTIDIPPDPDLEDLTYLGEDIQLFVSGELAFDGEIRKIDTQDKEGEDYSIVARPPGKKLKGSDLEENVSNEIFSDTISSIVDQFNEYDAEHEELVGSNNESETNVGTIGGNVKAVVSGTSGSVSYSSVGSDLSQVTSIYVKAYTPNTEKINFEVNTNSENYTQQLSDLDKNIYGEWVRITDLPNVNEQYTISFDLDENTLLIDWISVVNEEVNRDTTVPEVSPVDENVDFYSRSGQELEDNTEKSGSGIQFNSNGEPQTRQISAWSSNPFPVVGADDFVNGEGGEIEPNEFATTWDVTTSDPLKNWSLYARVKPYEIFVNRNEDHTLGNSIYDNSWSGSATPSTEQVAVQDSSVKITGDAEKNFQWLFDTNESGSTLTFSAQAYVPNSGNIEWYVHESDDGYGIQISSSEIELNRYDDGSGNVLDSVSFNLQENEWFDWTIEISDEGVDASVSDSNSSYNLSSGDTTHKEFDEFTIETITTHYLDDMLAEPESVGGGKDIETNTVVNGVSFNGFGSFIDSNYREWKWKDLVSYDFTSDFDNPLEGSFEVEVEATPGSDTAFIISPLVIVHEESEWVESNFDLTVHEPEGHLDYPPTYAQNDLFNTEVVFAEEVSNTNISESTVNSTVSTEVDVLSPWGPSQVIEGDFTDFPSPESSSTTTESYSYPGVEHIVQYTLSSAGQRDTDSPRTGFNRQTLSSYSVDFSTNDLEILFDRDLSDNRLALMNSLAEDSSVLFRWSGNTAEIFHRGQESTNVDLHSENITSSVSIEDVYESCEVIGLHNVRSGVITSNEAPEFVDDHKTIRTEDIESETDALNRARRFLNNHGSIKYKGSIKTLPTFAPLGAEVDGSLFNHGQDMIIRGVRYSKRGTTINLGYEKDIATELISLENETQGTKSRTSSKGMTIPVGPEQI
jgi:hypothetical protein